jgi:hypothetical protein
MGENLCEFFPFSKCFLLITFLEHFFVLVMNEIGVRTKFRIFYTLITFLSYWHFLQALNAYAQRYSQRYVKLKVYLYANICKSCFDYHKISKTEEP